jgi:hypothetical protein
MSNPELNNLIQDACASCHMPMARTPSVFRRSDNIIFADGFLNSNNDFSAIAIDGTSCMLCHQIESGRLGEPECFDGKYGVDSSIPAGERINYGPYELPPNFTTIMNSAPGFLPF